MRKTTYIGILSILTMTMLLGMVGVKATPPAWVPSYDDHVAGYTMLAEMEMSYYNYDRTKGNITAYSSVWYKNSTDGTTVGMLGVLALNFGVNVLDMELTAAAKTAIQMSHPDFSGDTVWDALVYMLNDSVFTGSVHVALENETNFTHAVSFSYLGGYNVIFGFTETVLLAVITFEIDSTWWDYYDQGILEDRLAFHMNNLGAALQALQTLWAQLEQAGMSEPSMPTSAAPKAAADSGSQTTSTEEAEQFANAYAGEVNSGLSANEQTSSESEQSSEESGEETQGQSIAAYPMAIFVGISAVSMLLLIKKYRK